MVVAGEKLCTEELSQGEGTREKLEKKKSWWEGKQRDEQRGKPDRKKEKGGAWWMRRQEDKVRGVKSREE